MSTFAFMQQQSQEAIISFKGSSRLLSNFAHTPFLVNGTVWPTSEHFFQACKTMNIVHCTEIRDATTPGIAKRMAGPKGYKGVKITLRENWDLIKISVMEYAVKEKFDQNPKAFEFLMSTGNRILIEGNTWHDNFWGNCYCPKCVDKPGLNNLGIILMNYRNSQRY